MNNARKQALRNTYNIIYNVNVNDVCNTSTIQTSIRTRIEDCKTQNLLHELDQKFMDWKINQKETQKRDEKKTENIETCPVCYEPIKSTNYIIPKCGHKLCLDCYKKCILSKKECANKCCLCRQQIL